jgi:hypothetical protein
MKPPSAAIGFRVKTGRAIAVIVAGPVEAPRVLDRRTVQLWDAAVPETQEPYHAALDLPEKEAARVIDRVTRAVQRTADQRLRELAEVLRGGGHRLTGVGLVVGSDIDPAKLGNLHVRAHALEGRLFRRVLEKAAGEMDVPWLTLVERELYDKSAAALGQPAATLRRIAAELGRPLGSPWGAEEKTASTAALVALAGR